MQLTFLPTRSDTRLSLEKLGETLVFNGMALDFSSLTEGDILPPEAIGCDWIAGPVARENGEIAVSLMLPHGADAPEETRFPAPLHLLQDGPVALPPYQLDDPAPGPGPGVQTTGRIDWAAVSTRLTREAQALAEWRTEAELPAAAFLFAMKEAGAISEAELLGWMTGQTPAAFEAALGSQSELDRFMALMPLRMNGAIKRNNPLVLGLALAPLDDTVMDSVFGG